VKIEAPKKGFYERRSSRKSKKILMQYLFKNYKSENEMEISNSL